MGEFLYLLHQIKKKYKKLYNNLINSMQVLLNKIDTTFMSSEKSKTSDIHRLVQNLTGKMKLKFLVNILYYQILISAIQEKHKKPYKIINLKTQPQKRIINLNYMMGQVLFLKSIY